MMPKVYPGVGVGGVVADTEPLLLSKEFLTSARNMQFYQGTAFTAEGNTLLRTAAEKLYWADYFSTQNFSVLLGASANTLYDLNDRNFPRALISGLAITDLPQLLANTTYGGLFIFTDSNLATPQVLYPSAGLAAITPLANWPEGLKAKFLTAHDNALFAFDITRDGTNYPSMVRTSSFAEYGAVPSSWDISDLSTQASEFSIDDRYAGTILAAVSVERTLVVMKDTCLYNITFQGGDLVWAKDKRTDQIGLAAPRAYTLLNKENAKLAFFSGEDFYIYDGVNLVDTLFKRNRRTILSLINTNFIKNCYMYFDFIFDEIVFAFPAGDAEYPNIEARYNFKERTETFFYKEETSHVSNNFVKLPTFVEGQEAVDLPFSDEQLFFADVGFEAFSTTKPNRRALEVCVAGSKAGMYMQGGSSLRYEETFERGLERLSLPIVDEELRVDYFRRKLVTQLNPRLRGGNVLIEVGAQEEEDDSIAWLEPFEYSPEDNWIDLPEPLSGRFFSFRVTAASSAPFRIMSFGLRYQLLGNV
jgi:hypothetical protein